jgi:hypothetical protein
VVAPAAPFAAEIKPWGVHVIANICLSQTTRYDHVGERLYARFAKSIAAIVDLLRI